MREPASAHNGNFFPWCSTALAGLFVIVSLWAAGAAPPLVAETEQQLAAAEANWQKHPYLEPRTLLELRLGADRVARERGTWAALRGEHAPPTPESVMRREQAALDELLAAAAAPLESLPARRLGVVPLGLRYETLLTHVPIHAGITHLVGNIVLLLFLGLYLETAWGRLRYLVVAAFAAAGTAAGYAIAVPESARPWVGASGLLAGLLPVFALHYRKARSDGFYWVGLVLGAVWLALPPLAAVQWSLDAAGASLLSGALPPIASYGAYAGAAVCAFAGYQVLRLTGLLAAFDPEGEDTQRSSAPDAGRVARLRASGRLEDAFEKANAWARREPDSLEAVLTLGEAARALARMSVARNALLRAVRLELKAGLLAAALDHWHELAASEVPRDAEPALLIRLATLLHEMEDREGACRALRGAIDNAGDASRAVVAGRVARAAREIDAQVAYDAAWLALQQPEIELEERQALEDLLGAVIPRMSREIEAPGVVARTGSDGRPVPIEIETNVRVLDAIEASPVELDDEGVHFATQTGQKKLMRYDRIQAVSVAAVQGLSEKPVLIVDLVLDWKARGGDRLRVIRLRADRFDPRRLVPGVASPLEALRQLVANVLARSRGVPLPDPDAARGMPFASFPDLALYQRLVLLAEGPAAPPPSAPPPQAAPPERGAPPSPPAPQEDLPEPVIEEPGAGPPEFWEFKA